MLNIKNLLIRSDSQLCVRHIEKKFLKRSGYECTDSKLIFRLEQIGELIKYFDCFNIEYISRIFNVEADSFVKYAKIAKRPIRCLPSSWLLTGGVDTVKEFYEEGN
jgi:hypothetical protein